MSTNKIKVWTFLLIGSAIAIIFVIIYFSRKPVEGNASPISSVSPDNVVIFMGSIISSLLVVVGVFFSMYFKNQSDAIKDLKGAIKELSDSINDSNNKNNERDILTTKLLFAYGQRMDLTDKMTADHNAEFEKRFEEHKKACNRAFKSKE